MLCIFAGGTTRTAVECQQILEAILPLEHSKAVQEVKGARLLHVLDTHGSVLSTAEAHQITRFSPRSLGALAVFPEGYSFGNGVTCNASLVDAQGVAHTVSWCVCPDPPSPALLTRWGDIVAIMEGP